LAAGADASKCKGLVRSAVWNNKIESVRILHSDFKADLNEIHPNGSTPILTALDSSYIDILGELLAFGADPNRDANGALPLLNAAEMAEPKCLSMLLEAGADPNKIRQSDGSNALMQAAYYGRTEAVTKLMERGAELELMDKAGNTAMDYAANRGHEEIVMLLLEGMS
jgi:ankyrin repeat protein